MDEKNIAKAKAVFEEAISIRNGECQEHFDKDEPCEICSQWNKEAGSCGLANKAY